MHLTSDALYRHGHVLLGTEILDLAKAKIDSNTMEKKNRIVSLMTKYYEREYCFNLIKEKHPLLTDEIIDNMNTKDLKVIIQYYSRDDDDAIPSRKDEIKLRAKQVYQRIPHAIRQYLETKNADENDVCNLEEYGTVDQLTSNIRLKYAAEKKAAEINRVEKIIAHYRKLSEAYKNIADKYGDFDDILKMTLTELKAIVSIKRRPEDDSTPTTKKDLAQRCELTKGREVLGEKEYLTMFANTTEDVICTVVGGDNVVDSVGSVDGKFPFTAI